MILPKSQMTEEDIKLNYITPAINAAGWQNGINITMETRITDWRINLSGNIAYRENPKKVDYLLYSACVSHEFASTNDACCLIAYANDLLWCKACFECTEEGEHAVVTVMTDGRSDDANSVRIEDKKVWLQMCRRGDVISVQYSTDGENWIFVRILRIELPATVRLGILAQSPVGAGG